MNGRRGSHLFGGVQDSAAKSVGVAALSTVVVFAVLGYLIVNTPGWTEFQQGFFDSGEFSRSLPSIGAAFLVNIKLFLLAEVFILVLALLLAVMRSLDGPVFLPFRIISVVYTDFFRGVPGILIVYVLGFGIPSLQIPGVTIDPFFWALVALILVYSAYVAEVYRAGIDSVHSSQNAAARSLGLSRAQALRYVVLPQAVRRVIPPLLNDFIGLQKDTALVSFLGVVEAFQRANIISAGDFNFTPYAATAVFFLIITVPMARFVDWLVARDRRRQMAGAGAR